MYHLWREMYYWIKRRRKRSDHLGRRTPSSSPNACDTPCRRHRGLRGSCLNQMAGSDVTTELERHLQVASLHEHGRARSHSCSSCNHSVLCLEIRRGTNINSWVTCSFNSTVKPFGRKNHIIWLYINVGRTLENLPNVYKQARDCQPRNYLVTG